ncbi:hypothetical protein [Legionella jamestowniensis]|uniref:Uncharacterized protein n=1 Tax=Legionella jamestowniensis TaxID=455 RepID=A0A0W0UUG7_9GAMM|nr:hypothetical protein [Legionella jamestowniensis]KTD11222.1 hypothetical protein Ljam_0416 [Legionella jamestowniensis]OCH98082.1 hypothetical protein A8135_13045 [Legionella jamestowniensis]SFL70365.1 hypothetical protein SAMN02746073_1499 [Legionella jamestowniensis DSM 19215]
MKLLDIAKNRNPEPPSPSGANIRKDLRHPERSEGSPRIMEMSHSVCHWECNISVAKQSSIRICVFYSVQRAVLGA